MTPFSHAVASGEGVHRAPKQALVSVSRSLEARAASGCRGDLVVVTLQHAVNLTPLTRAGLDHLADRGVSVAVFGVGLDLVLGRSPARWDAHELASDSELTREWAVVVRAAHTHVALLAREAGPVPSLTDQSRLFDYVVTDSSGVVSAVIDLLLGARGRTSAVVRS